ncbi:MAG: SDR family oxidoreductase, partial [Leptospiraceae bacterium]|nr:SDR family oxidoreductase [Leptospiraceae bacterium]
NSLKNLEELKINFEPLKQLLKFSSELKEKTIHYAGTLSTLLLSDLKDKTLREKFYLSQTKYLIGSYSASKWLAEKILFDHGNKFKIYRIGLLVKNSKFDIFPKEDFFSLFLKGLNSWNLINYKKKFFSLDYTPVDIAAKTLVNISLSKSSKNIFHICNPNELFLEELLFYFNNQNFKFPLNNLSKKYIMFLEYSIQQNSFKKHSKQLFLRTAKRINTSVNPEAWKNDLNFSEEILNKYLQL